MTKMITVNGECRFEFKVRAEYENGGRTTYTIWANNEYDARKMASEQLGAGWKIIWVK